jgi:uncharacterized membrane protein YciS (DUF1049 family)
MPGGIDTAMGTLTMPIWAAGAVCAVFVVALIVAVGRVGATAFIATMFRIAIVLVAVVAGYFYLQNRSDQERAAARRSLDERSAALMARAIAPGSALSCLDELAGETVEAACEKAVFSSPEAIAAAVSYVTAKLSLLADGTEHAQHVDTDFAAELVPLRTALELDRFGIVAHVLRHEGCTADRCDSLARLNDTSHVLVNLREQPFDEEVAKYAAAWNAPGRGSPLDDSTVAAAPPPAPPANPTPGPASVAPRFDFPSSQSIPPVSIMAPEPAAPRQAAAPPPPAVQAAPDGPATPVPPRRPPQVRSTQANAPARPPAVRAEPPPPADTLGPR